MNLTDLFPETDKALATQNVLKSQGVATLLRIRRDAVLKEHQSATDALLVLLSGQAVYEQGNQREVLSAPHDFVKIPAKTTHKVTGTEDAMLLLIQ